MNTTRMSDRARSGLHGLSVGVATALGAFLLSCIDGHTSRAQQPAPTKQQESTIQTATPKKQALRREIILPGTIKAYEEVPLQSKIAGYVEKINVDIGDKVKKGDLLAKLWAPELEEDLNIKRAKIVQREADLKQSMNAAKAADAEILKTGADKDRATATVTRAEAMLARWTHEVKADRELVDKGVLDKQTLDEAVNKLKAAEATLNEAKSEVGIVQATLKLDLARREKGLADIQVAEAALNVAKAEYAERKAWLNYTQILAPFDGVVSRRNINTGSFVAPPTAGAKDKQEGLLVVERIDILRVVVQVAENDAGLIKEGTAATIHLPALQNREIAAKVTRTASSFDSSTGTLRVEIVLDNAKEDLKPGMYGQVALAAGSQESVTLPAEAILSDGAVKYCYFIENGKATRRNIRVGAIANGQAEVTAKQVPSAKPGEEGTWEPLSGSERAIIFDLSSIPESKTLRGR